VRDLHSLKGLGWILGIPKRELLALIDELESYYRPFEVCRPGKPPRAIDRPVGKLKEVQKRVRKKFLANSPLDEGVRACVKGGSTYNNADVHCNQKNFVRVDVKNCYPSMTSTMAFRTFQSIGFGPKTASVLTKLSTRLGHLPQGAPTSDMIANLILRPVDHRVREICRDLDLERGRCMDDICVSGENGTRQALELIVAAIRDIGLAVRHKKTKHAGPQAAHITTGYTTNGPWGPKVVKTKVQEIRTSVYQLICAHLNGEDIGHRLPSIRGSLGYLRRTNAGAVRRLERQLDAAGIQWRGRLTTADRTTVFKIRNQ